MMLNIFFVTGSMGIFGRLPTLGALSFNHAAVFAIDLLFTSVYQPGGNRPVPSRPVLAQRPDDARAAPREGKRLSRHGGTSHLHRQLHRLALLPRQGDAAHRGLGLAQRDARLVHVAEVQRLHAKKNNNNTPTEMKSGR